MYIFIRKEIFNQYKSQIKSYLYGTGGLVSFSWLYEDGEDRYGEVSIFTAIRSYQFEKVGRIFLKL
jgi:hypothetical protein